MNAEELRDLVMGARRYRGTLAKVTASDWQVVLDAARAPEPAALDETGPDLVFSTSPAPDGIDTDCMFLASPNRISVHISRRAINAQVARAAEGSKP